MSRFSEYNDAEQWQYALWAGRVKQAMNGRPALKVYREMEAALLALPAPRLIAETICDGADVCAVGAYALYKRVQAGEEREVVLTALEADPDDADSDDTALLGKRHGMTYTMAWELGNQNDYWYSNLTPEQRYEATLRDMRQNINRLSAKFEVKANA